MRRVTILLAAAVLAVLAGGAARAADPPALSREQIEQIVRDTIKKSPEIVIEALQAVENQRREAAHQQAKQNLVARHDEIVSDPGSPVAGNASGDVTVVEFFDYACPHCKNVVPTVKQLLKEDGKIRLVYKEYPILGPASIVASHAALAARAQDKYLPLHDALMALKEPLTEATIFRVAKQVGLDVDRLKTDMAAPAIEALIEKNYALGQALGINGTPAFVIGGEVAPGAVPLARLKQFVARARAPK
jgi:protein-disulfide isomerase